ncbi:MAG: glycosyltransferase [Candidatus Omnitrophota bacterium]
MNEWFAIDAIDSVFFEKNRNLFQKRYPELSLRILESRSRLSDYSFLQVGEHRYACRRQESNGFFYLYRPDAFQTQLQEAYDRARAFYRRGAELLLIVGGGLGYLASHIVEDIRGDLSKGVVLLENRPELILAQWHFFDGRPLIESNQVYWAVGDPILPEMESFAQREALFLLSDNGLCAAPERELKVEEKQECQQIPRWFAAWRAEARRGFQAKSAMFSQRMAQPPDLVGGCVWAAASPLAYAHTPLMRSMVEGFRNVGWRGRLLELGDSFSARFQVHRDLLEYIPDLIVTINNASSTFLAPNVRRPRLCWALDNPCYFQPEQFQNLLGEMDHVFYCDRTYAEVFSSVRAGSTQQLTVSSTLFQEGVYRDDLAAPIMFVGNFHDAAPYLRDLAPKLRDGAYAILDYCIAHPLQTAQDALAALDASDELIQRLREKSDAFAASIQRPLPPNVRLEYFLYALANGHKRVKYVRALLDRGIVLYGPETWLPVMGEKYAAQFRGWLPSHRLADAYASAEICLNIHSLQCPTCFNVRDFDVLSAGGCLIADEIEDMKMGLLQPGMDFFSFQDEKDLIAKIDELSASPEKRRQLREQGHETFQQRHTPAHRAEEILAVLRDKWKT